MNKLCFTMILFLIFVYITPVPVKSDPTFTVRGWDLGTYKPDNINQWIDDAERAGINTLTFSADIIMDWWQLFVKDPDENGYPDPADRSRNIENWCAYAQSKGMDVYLWNHAIELGEDVGLTPPAGVLYRENGLLYLDFDDPNLWAWLDSTYQKVMDKVPSMSGIVLSLTEARWQIHRGPHEPFYEKNDRKIASSLPPDRRMAKVLNTMRNTLAARGKKLIVRGFFRTPLEHEFLASALDSVPDDVGVYSKHVPNDFRYNYAPNPLLGKFPNRIQLMEVEPARIGAAGYYQSLYQSARDLGMNGIIPRIRIDINTFRDFNNFCYNQLIHDPDADIESMWTDFFLPYYGNQTALDTAKSVLKRAFDIFKASNYTVGFYLGKNMSIEAIDKSDYRIDTRDAALWTDDPVVQHIYDMLREGDPSVIEMAVAEDQWAEQETIRCLDDLESAKNFFDNTKYNELRAVFEEFRVFTRSMQVWAPAYLSYRFFRNHPSDSLAIERVRNAAEAIFVFLTTESSTEGLKEFALELSDLISYCWNPVQQGWNIYDGSILPEKSIPPWREMDKTAGLTENGVSDLFTIVDDPEIPGNKLISIEELSGDRKESFGYEWSISDPNIGVTCIFRAKPSPAILNIQADDGRTYSYIYVSLRNGKYRDQLTLKFPQKLNMEYLDKTVDLPTYGQWHIYRFTLQNNQVNCYIDENPNPVISGITPKSMDDNFIKWGETSTAGLFGGLFDWIIWDMSGAYAPGQGTALPNTLTGLKDFIAVNSNEREIHEHLHLSQNSPNPFNLSTGISFIIGEDGWMNLKIYDITGKLIRTLAENNLSAGNYRIIWNGDDERGYAVSSGVYLGVLKSKDAFCWQKMILIK